MRPPILIAAAILAACGRSHSAPSAFERESAQYEFMKKHGASIEDRCAQAQIVKNAAASEQRADDYDLWKLTAEADCLEMRMRL